MPPLDPILDPFCSITNLVMGTGSDAVSRQVHVMSGAPIWLAMVALACILFLTHAIVALRDPSKDMKSYAKWDLLQIPFLNALVKKPWFPLATQSAFLGAFLLIVSAGLFGNQNLNIATTLTWTWWWALLIFLVAGGGTVFCAMCPWEAVSSWVTSMSIRSRVKQLGLERAWPKWARNMYPAIVLFTLLTWYELGHDVTHSPSMTALMGLVMLTMAVMAAIVFERRAFCRYVCLVGRITGIYSLFSPLEIRSRSRDVCVDCSTKDCYRGNETSTGCPTNLFPATLAENTYCTTCTECIRACPHDNLTIQIRPVSNDLFRKNRFEWDESILAVILLSLTTFHGLTMTPHWTVWNHWLRAQSGLGPEAVFTMLMLAVLGICVGAYFISSVISKFMARGSGIQTGRVFKAYAYSLIPVALFYHLAHNCMHFFMEGQNLIPLLSDPFGWGWNLFGTSEKIYRPLLGLPSIWVIQMVMIVVGHIYGVLIADKISLKLFVQQKKRILSLIPLLLLMILYSSVSIWLIAQPMLMKSGM
jgi:polyferredoxin